MVNYKKLINELKGTTVPKPLSGTLSGHAAGEPFDKHVNIILKQNYSNKVFRQFEYLNYLFNKNPDAVGVEARNALINSPTLLFLLSRGKNATDKWSIENPFEEKQNDTADIIVVDDLFEIIDIKTRNIAKSSQPPNIISAYKLAQTCAKMIDNSEFDTFEINYIEIDWFLKEDKFLVCNDAHHKRLFRTKPSELYINWSAAMQIQFHVANLSQDFDRNIEEWARDYLKHFVKQAKKRAKDMIDKFVKPFEKYI